MIKVKNTVELQENYKLNEIADTDEVMVMGGLYNKDKYDQERYNRRVTYSGRDIKNIIVKMQEIEATIPVEWGQLQRAKYIYETLGKDITYDYDHDKRKDQQSSNLTILQSKEGICAGYSLLYKEMMDRQGISCDYVRGYAENKDGDLEKHAWNVLNINGKAYPVDLTWDANIMQKNGKVPFFAGKVFAENHRCDRDEIHYDFSYLTREEYNSINTRHPLKKMEEMDIEQKRVYVEEAIHETFKKFSNIEDPAKTLAQCRAAIEKYIFEGYPKLFTNNNNARSNLEKFVSSEDMLKIVSNMYVDMVKDEKVPTQSGFGKATRETLEKYNKEQASFAVENFVSKGSVKNFTKEENRKRLAMEDQWEVVDKVADSIILGCERSKSESEKVAKNIAKKSTYDAYELSKVADRVPKEKGIIGKAFDWMRGKQKAKEEKERLEFAQREANNEYMPRHAEDPNRNYTKE